MLRDFFVGRDKGRKSIQFRLRHNDAVERVARPLLIERGSDYIGEGQVTDANAKFLFQFPQNILRS